MKPHASLLPLIASAALCLSIGLTETASSQVLFTTDFSAATDYDNNFVKLLPNGTSNILWNNSEYLNKTGTGVQSIIFDTSATGGSGGSGGTGGAQADNDYTNVTVSSVFQVSSLNTASLGFWTHGNDSSSSAYLGLINPLSATSIQLRIFDSNSNPTTTAVGTALTNQTISLAPATLAANTYYTGVFSAVNNGATSVTFTLSLYDAAGTNLIASTSITDTTSPVFVGQVGLRQSSQTMQVTQFTVVPEPTGASLILFGAAVAACRTRRRTPAQL